MLSYNVSSDDIPSLHRMALRAVPEPAARYIIAMGGRYFMLYAPRHLALDKWLASGLIHLVQYKSRDVASLTPKSLYRFSSRCSYADATYPNQYIDSDIDYSEGLQLVAGAKLISHEINLRLDGDPDYREICEYLGNNVSLMVCATLLEYSK